MENLQGYSSESDCESVEEENQIDQQSPEIEEQNLHRDTIKGLTVYLQNYAEKQANMEGIFIALPWMPSYNTFKMVQGISRNVLTKIRRDNTAFYNQCEWRIIADPSLRVGTTNSYINDNYHITILKNFHAPKLKAQRFVSGLKNGINDMHIEPKLIKIDHQEVAKNNTLNRLLFRNESSTPNNQSSQDPLYPKCLLLQFSPHLKLLRNNTNNNIFITAPIVMTPETKAFFQSVYQIVKDNWELLGLKWNHGFPNHTYHVSLIAATTATPISKREIDFLNHWLQQNPMPQLQLTPVNINSLASVAISNSQLSEMIPLPVNTTNG